MTDNRTTERVDHPPRVREAIDELMREKDANDNRTTELLCELLEERGIDYKLRRASGTSARETVYWEYEKDGDWASAEYAVTVPLEGHGHLSASCLTPEQAIAATLGNSRAERTCECIAEYAKSPIDGKTIVLHRCSSCHELMRPHMSYCPNCGCKVVDR